MVPIVNEMQNVNASTQTVAHRQNLNVNKTKNDYHYCRSFSLMIVTAEQQNFRNDQNLYMWSQKVQRVISE